MAAYGSIFAVILMVARRIWKNQNEVRHGQRKQTATKIYEKSTRLLEEYQANAAQTR